MRSTSETTVSPINLSWARFRGEQKNAAKIFIALLALYTVARGIRAALATPFWFDEFFTLKIAGQQTLGDMWTVLARGFDAQPPLFYLIEKLALGIPIKKEVALRLPSILAFPCILLCVFAFVRRRSGEFIACLCALILLSTSLFHTYMIDARPYAAPVACIALALVCYQHLPERRWLLLFAASLVAAELLNYYAFLAVTPFWFAEAALVARWRRFRWPVWTALVVGLLPLAFGVSTLLRARLLYGPHIFSRPVFSRALEYYASYFLTDRVSGLAILATSIAAIVWWTARGDRGGLAESDPSALPEGILLLGFVVLPLVGFVLARVGHGALLDRYVLAATIGIALGVSCALCVIRSPAAAALLAIFVLSRVCLPERQFWLLSGIDPLSENHYSARSTSEFDEIQGLVEGSGHPDLPVVVDDGPTYFQMVHYSASGLTKRLLYLTDEQKELSYHGTDTTVRVFELIRDSFPLRLANYSDFVSTHPEFLVYAAPEGWALYAIRQEGASAEVLKTSGPRTVYLVKMKSSSAAGQE